MPVVSTGSSITVILGASAYLLRRRVSKKWIDLRKTNKTDLSGKTFIITGGNTGLGYEVAKDFSRRNARNVAIACRDDEKGREAVRSIVRATGKDNVECLNLDLASLASVKDFINKVRSEAKYSSVHGLVCNAGVWIPEDEKKIHRTKDGLEMHFGVNHLSHLLLSTGLTEQLSASGDGRIVFVSSSLMKSGQIDMEDRGFVRDVRKINEEKSSSFGPPAAYCDSKLMNVLTCKHLSTLLPPSVTTYAVCPGFCRSSLGRNVQTRFYQRLLLAPVMLMIQRSSQLGAQNIIFATIEDKDRLKNGTLYKDGEVAEEHMDYVASFGDDLPRQFFELSEGLIREILGD